MSTDYSFSISYGFEVSFKQLLETFGKDVEELSHMEERYDVFTGKKLQAEKVVDREAGRAFSLGGKEYGWEELDEFLSALSKKARAYAVVVDEDHHRLQEEGDLVLFLPRRGPKDLGDSIEYSRSSGHGSYRLSSLAKMIPEMKALKDRLRRAGVRGLGEPVVRIIGSCG